MTFHIDQKDGVQVGLGTQFIGRAESYKIQIGIQETKGIYWIPTQERNWNFGVFGESGSGKTQVIKNIVSQLKAKQVSYIVLDSFGEYASKEAANQEFGQVVSLNEISVNPLEIANGKSLSEHVYSVVDTLNAIFNLNDIQAHYLKDAIRRSYREKGIYEDNPETWTRTPPIFLAVNKLLVEMEQQSKDVKDLLQKTGPSLNSPLFSRDKTMMPFERLVSGPVVLNLGALGTNEMKALASEFILAKIPRFVENLSVAPQLFVVVDGAPNLFRMHSSSLQFLMEARRSGVGVIFPYRDPNNLPEIAFNSTATIMTFRQSDTKVAKLTAERLNTAEQTLNKNLTDKFSAVVRFSSMTEAQRLSTLAYSKK